MNIIQLPSHLSGSSPTPVLPILPPPLKQQSEFSEKKVVQVLSGSIIYLNPSEEVYECGYKLGNTWPLESIRLSSASEVISKRMFCLNANKVQNITTNGLISAPKLFVNNGKPVRQQCPLGPKSEDNHHLNTFVIRYYAQLKTFIKLIGELDALGCTLEGENIGRSGTVSWIIFAARNTLIPLDVIGLSQQTSNLWDVLKKNIFSNDKVVKVFHDCRPCADYLFHRHNIALSNVFDIQVADANVQKNTTGKLPTSFRPLSTCITMYKVGVFQEEIEFLKKYEDVSFASRSPWMIKPLPPQEILKLGALKVKYLTSLRETLVMRLLKKFNSCVQAHIDVIHSESTAYFLHKPSEMCNLVEAILLSETDP